MDSRLGNEVEGWRRNGGWKIVGSIKERWRVFHAAELNTV